MISSGALPKVTLSRPPIPGPERAASSSVASPISAAVGTIPIAAAPKTTADEAWTTSSSTAIGMNGVSRYGHPWRCRRNFIGPAALLAISGGREARRSPGPGLGGCGSPAGYWRGTVDLFRGRRLRGIGVRVGAGAARAAPPGRGGRRPEPRPRPPSRRSAQQVVERLALAGALIVCGSLTSPTAVEKRRRRSDQPARCRAPGGSIVRLKSSPRAVVVAPRVEVEAGVLDRRRRAAWSCVGSGPAAALAIARRRACDAVGELRRGRAPEMWIAWCRRCPRSLVGEFDSHLEDRSRRLERVRRPVLAALAALP